MADQEVNSNDKFWYEMDYDDAVTLNQELQAKQMFFGADNNITIAEKKLLIFTQKIIDGTFEEVQWN